MPVQIGGQRDEPGFDQPLGFMCDCHGKIEHYLEMMLLVAETAAGPLRDSHRHALETALAYFRTGGPQHTADEEKSLFPRLRDSADPRLATMPQLVSDLLADHRQAAGQHAELDELVSLWLHAGRLSPTKRQRLLELLRILQAMYRKHISLEATCVFRAAGECLTRKQLQEVGREMAARRGLG